MGILPTIRPYGTLFPHNFQSTFRIFIRYIALSIFSKIFINDCRFLLLVPPTCVILAFLRLNYNYLVIWHSLHWPPFATMMMYRVILHWSVYYPDHKKRNFAIHINQYNDLTLRIFLSSPCLATKVSDMFTSILVSHLASYTISQQGITPSKLSWLKTLWWDILFSMFVGEIRFHVLISTLQTYYTTYVGICQPPT